MTPTIRPGRTALRLAAAFLLACATVPAAPPAEGGAKRLDRDLGLGLHYYRIHELPVDLPAAQAARSCVIDVRYVQAEAAAATAFLAWLAFHASAQNPVFVLANAETGAALRHALGSRESRPAFIVVGIASGTFHPDLAVRTSADDERRAYDALEKGAAIAALLVDHPDKIRNDEASLASERAVDPSTQLTARDGPPPPVDATLQRAVHIHRALLALRKI